MKQRFYTLKDISLTPIDYGKKNGLTWGIVRGKWVYDDVVPLFKKCGIVVDFSSRGFFETANYKDIAAAKCNSIRDIQSYGLGLWVKMLIWRMWRVIRKTLHLSYDADYIVYRRRKEKSKMLR